MNRAVAACCLFMTLLSFASRKSFAQPPQTAASPTAQISLSPKLDAKVIGTVLDPNGVPLEGCMVYAFTDGSSPPRDVTVTTDFNGNFAIDVYSGHVQLFAYKESDLYHNNMFRFDVPVDTDNQSVEVRSGETVRGFMLHLPRQSALLRFDVYNADTNDPVNPVEYELCREDHAADPTYCLNGSASDHDFQLVVPPDPISIKIAAPNYMEWRYLDAKTGSSYLALKSTENRTLAVYLHQIIKNAHDMAQISPAQYPTQPDQSIVKIGLLYDRLIQPSETNSAAGEIFEIAKDSPAARDFMAQKLPSMIGERPTNLIWMNAVRLAGQLKLTSTIPALKQALSLDPIRGGYDYSVSDNYPSPSEGAKLRYDIVGRALADIGDPSIPAVADVLSNGEASMRKRRLIDTLEHQFSSCAEGDARSPSH